jgi:hypothetical protein
VTVPIEHGYPDYGRYQARADVILLNENTTISVNTTKGPFFVGGFTHLGIGMAIFGGVCTLQFDYLGDQAGAVQLASQLMSLRTDDTCAIAIPIMGPWVKLTISPGALPLDYLLSLWTAAGPGFGSPLGLNDNVLLSVDGVNVNAATTRTDDLVAIWPGEASFFADFPAGANFTIKLLSVDKAGATKLLAYVDQNTPQGNRNVFLPPTHLRVTSLNSDAAAHPVFLSLVARPFDPGR